MLQGCPTIALVVTILPEVNRRKPFKVFNFWMKNNKFHQVLQDSWNKEVEGSPMLRLCLVLKGLKPELKILNNEYFSNISRRVLEAKVQLEKIQEACFRNPCNACFSRGGEVYIK